MKETPLCKLALKYGTDKCPKIKHSYTPYYYKLLKGRKRSIKKVLEIGVGYPTDMKHCVYYGRPYQVGASLRMWRDFFPNAMVYGCDIAPQAIFEDDRIKTFYCNQGDELGLDELIEKTGTDIDLVIDDGSHECGHQISTCLHLMPKLKKSAIYIIEDVSSTRLVVGSMRAKFKNVKLAKFKSVKTQDDNLVIVKK